MHFKTAKMTAKEKGAIEKVAEIYQLSTDDMRKDRAAVREMYNELEGNGYQWVALKQEWAYMGKTDAFEPRRNIVFVAAVDGETPENALYILTEGLKAAGYEINSAFVVFDSNQPITAFIHVEVKP